MNNQQNTFTQLEALRQDVSRLFSLLEKGERPDLPRWVKSWQVMHMLGISKGKLRQWRNEAKLPFVKIDGLIFYDLEDVKKLMNPNRGRQS